MRYTALRQPAAFFLGQFLIGAGTTAVLLAVDQYSEYRGHYLNALLNLGFACSLLTTPGLALFAFVILVRLGRQAPPERLWLSALAGGLSALTSLWGGQLIESVQRLCGWEEDDPYFTHLIFGGFVFPLSGALMVTHLILRTKALATGGFPVEEAGEGGNAAKSTEVPTRGSS
jgi:hypothetical protein